MAGEGSPGDPRDWRPMAFGRKAVRSIREPLVEPRWAGQRLLAHLDPAAADLVPPDGMPLGGHAEIRSALLAAARTGSLVLDGFLVELPAAGSVGAFADPGPAAPTLGDTTRLMVLGGRLGSRGADRRGGMGREHAPSSGPEITAIPGSAIEAPAADARATAPGAPEGERLEPAERVLVFVAFDLLAVDGEPLLNAPLLERKRLLDGALAASHLVRLSQHVRPPVEPWYRQWRAFGFRELLVRGANGRYRPGAIADDWAIARIPDR